MSTGSSHARTDEAAFPAHGARARQWGRFERELDAWLRTPHGRFAAWRAERTVAGDPPFCARRARIDLPPVSERQF